MNSHLGKQKQERAGAPTHAPSHSPLCRAKALLCPLPPGPWPSRTSPHHKGKTSPASTQGLEHTRIAQGGSPGTRAQLLPAGGKGALNVPE